MVAIVIAVIVVAALVIGFFAYRAIRDRQAQRAIAHDKLTMQRDGHRQEADLHASRAAELGPQIEAHREAAEEHARRAEELEERVVREGRAAAFHDQRAAETEEQRERL